MAVTTEIPWGDGSGDKIYLTRNASEGDQNVQVSSDANTGAARSKVVTFTSGVGNIQRQLTINQAAGLPYTPLNYIETDGVAYINPGIKSANSISAKLKVMIPSATKCIVLGRGPDPGSSENAGTCILLMCNTSSSEYRAGYVHRYRYLNSANPPISSSVTNRTPFECRSSQKTGSQGISVSLDGGDTWTTRTSTQNSNYGSTAVMYLFRSNSNTPDPCPLGTRIYYCQIFNSVNYTNLAFDGIPCIYNGEYGLWDLVSNSFFGNAAGSGAFTGA